MDLAVEIFEQYGSTPVKVCQFDGTDRENCIVPGQSLEKALLVDRRVNGIVLF